MIRFLDTNALIALQKGNLHVREEHACFVPREIEEEFLADAEAESWFRKNVFAAVRLDEADFLTAYAKYLNGYRKVSFYNLKGFGDVAILAVLDIVVNAGPPTMSLSDDLFPQHSIRLVSDDDGLGKFARKTFNSRVIVERSADFIATAFPVASIA